MKKLAIIMLAVVSMALVSCGGGGGNNQEKKEAKKYEPATPAITYSVPNVLDREKIELDEFKGCFEVKNVGVRESAAMELTASATLEVVKDLPEYMYKGCCDLVLYDENMVQIGKRESFEAFFERKEKGDVFTVSVTISTGSRLASGVINEVKYVQVKDLGIWKD